jgi:hypothetical protein
MTLFMRCRHDPNNPRYLYTRAMLCKGLGLFEQSIADLNFVRRVYPNWFSELSLSSSIIHLTKLHKIYGKHY